VNAFRRRYQASHESIIVVDMPLETLRLVVRGMTCDHCARSVQRKLAATPGVKQATVDLQGGNATIDYDSGRVKPEDLANAVRQIGYEVPA
jgi:copper chaperone